MPESVDIDGSSLLVPLRDAGGSEIAIWVPTVWSGVMQAAKHEPSRWNIRHLRRVVCGGGPNLELIEFFDRHHAAELIHSWGMTEINPVGTMGRHATTAEEVALDAPQRRKIALKAGRPLPILEVEVLDERGQPVPHDDRSVGTLVVRGPTVRGGFAAEDASTLAGGWMPTGDVATIDDRGRVRRRSPQAPLGSPTSGDPARL